MLVNAHHPARKSWLLSRTRQELSIEEVAVIPAVRKDGQEARAAQVRIGPTACQGRRGRLGRGVRAGRPAGVQSPTYAFQHKRYWWDFVTEPPPVAPRTVVEPVVAEIPDSPSSMDASRLEALVCSNLMAVTGEVNAISPFPDDRGWRPHATINPPSPHGHGDRQQSLHQTRGASVTDEPAGELVSVEQHHRHSRPPRSAVLITAPSKTEHRTQPAKTA